VENPFGHALRALAALVACLASLLPLSAQIIGPDFSGPYSVRDVGSVPGLPEHYGGLTFKAGSTNRLLIGGDANSSSAKVFEVEVVRDAQGHITGFTNEATPFANASGLPNSSGGLDGGLAYGPGGLLFFTSYPDNSIGQIKPGHILPSKYIDLSLKGIDQSVGGLVFVPTNFAGAGHLKILVFANDNWHDATLSPDGSGTYNLSVNPVPVPLSGGPEGAFYVKAGSQGFTRDSVLISEYSDGNIAAYDIDANGDPLPNTRRVFITDVQGPEGAALDPVTGDFLFSTFGGANRVLVVGGFSTPPPRIAITYPENNSTLPTPASFYWTVAPTEPGTSLSEVRFYLGTNLFATETSAPWETWVDLLPPGSYDLTAVAVDASRQTATSSVVRLTVSLPTLEVQLLQPPSNALFRVCTPISLLASVGPGPNPGATVSFFDGATLLARVTNAPFAYLYTNALSGPRALRATAETLLRQTGTSATVPVLVSAPPLHTLVAAAWPDHSLRLCCTAEPGSNYVFEAAPNLGGGSAPAWQPLLTNTAAGGLLEYLDQAATNLPRRFYRARQVP
jgi:hypothetical protein